MDYHREAAIREQEEAFEADTRNFEVAIPAAFRTHREDVDEVFLPARPGPGLSVAGPTPDRQTDRLYLSI